MKISQLSLAVFCAVLGVRGICLSADINAATVSYADVSAAVALANYGDTVYVPAGESNWGDSRLVITKGIRIIGAGRNKTIIKSTASKPPADDGYKSFISFEADSITAANDYAFVFKGFHIKAEGLYPRYSLLNLANSHYSNHLTKVAVSENIFQQLAGTDYSCMAIELNMAIFGVVYNNEIIDGSHAWRFLGSLNSGKNVVFWEPGSPYAMYFEDNYIRISKDWNTSQIISGGNGNRYVSRYNTFDLSQRGPAKFMQTHDAHGNQPNNNGGSIGFEAYGEHRIGGSGRWLDQRAGRVNMFMNRWSYSNGSSYTVWEEYDDDTYMVTSCAGLGYPTTSGGINCLQRPYNSYYWRNFTGLDGTTLVTGLSVIFDHYNRSTPTLNDPLVLFENLSWHRDNSAAFTGVVDAVGSCGYYGGPDCSKSGIGCGSYGDMMAIKTCNEGTAFWVSETGCGDIAEFTGFAHTKNIEGTLYRCGKTNNWEAYYKPYTYPHPLRGETSKISPTAPINLKVR